MTGTIRIGCSGWIYRHWRERYYPAKMAQRLWYGFYADTFETVELNTSFYHLPKPETFTKWQEQAPPGFRYAVKAPRFITHMKKLKECAEPVEEFLTRARRLGEALGPIASPRLRARPRNSSTGSWQSFSFFMWVMKRGAFTAYRKPSGAWSRHFVKVSGFGRW